NYVVNFTFLRDCAGNDAPGNVTLYVQSQTCQVSTTFQLDKLGVVTLEYCDVTSTTCNGGANPGYEKVTYAKIITLPLDCPDWIISVNIDFRNATSYGTVGTMTLKSMINNAGGLCNDSPLINDNMIIIGCAYSNVMFNHGISNTNGDNTVVSIKCPESVNSPMPYTGGMSCTNPYPNYGGFALNGNTLTFTPNHYILGTSVMAFKIEEYNSNGDLIGWVEREMQIVILPTCFDNAPTSFEKFPPDFGFVIDQGQPACVTVYVTDPDGDPISNVEVILNQMPPNANYGVNINGSSATVIICFHEQNADCVFENYGFTIEATSPNCFGEVLGSQYFYLWA